MSLARSTGRRTEAQTVGGEAEEHAARFLTRQGLAIVGRNYRTKFGEIDLIARDGETLVFVEVRLRSSDRFGGAASSIDSRKQRRIESAARHYLSRLRVEPPCRFDVITLGGAQAVWLRGAFDAASY